MSLETNDSKYPFKHEPEETRVKRNPNLMYIGVIVALLGVCIYLFVSRNNALQKSVATSDTLIAVTTDRDNIQNEYDAALSRLDNLTGRNAQLDSMVAGQSGEIQRLRNQIQGILSNAKATSSDLSKARSLIAELNNRVKNYEERIAELEQENKQLNDYNQVVTKERDSTVTTNIALAQKVRLGAVLHASNIRLQPIDLRRNGRKEKTTERARKVDVLRIIFDIDENRIAQNGVKDLYLRILDPNGNLLSNAAYGSGVTDTYDGQTLNYTLAKQVDLKQNTPVQNIVADWNQDSDYAKGSYKIEVYNEGYKIGNGSITLR